MPDHIFVVEPIGAHGGMERFDKLYCSALARKGWLVTLITCDKTQFTCKEFTLWTPFKNIYSKSSSILRGFRYLFGWFLVLLRAYQCKKSQNVVINQHFITFLPIELLMVWLAKFLRIKVILTAHDIFPFNNHPLNSLLLKVFYLSVDSLIVLSDSAKQVLENLIQSEKTIHMLPHGNFHDAFKEFIHIPRDEAQKRLNIAHGPPIVLFLGRIDRKGKGVDHLIRTMSIVIDEIPSARLIIGGRADKESITTFESLAKQLGVMPNIDFHWGYVKDTDLPVYYRAANVIALPYTQVFQSGVVQVAFALNRSVVAFAVGGLTEQIIDGKTGILIPPLDEKAFAMALIDLLKNPLKADMIAEAGYSSAAKSGNWDVIAAKFTEIYRELVSS